MQYNEQQLSYKVMTHKSKDKSGMGMLGIRILPYGGRDSFEIAQKSAEEFKQLSQKKDKGLMS